MMSNSSAGESPIQRPLRRKSRWSTVILAVVILVPSCLAFGKKLAELISLAQGAADGVFAITPVVNYLLASLGFFFLFCWAILNGMFSDIEDPKRSFLETERMLDDERI